MFLLICGLSWVFLLLLLVERVYLCNFYRNYAVMFLLWILVVYAIVFILIVRYLLDGFFPKVHIVLLFFCSFSTTKFLNSLGTSLKPVTFTAFSRHFPTSVSKTRVYSWMGSFSSKYPSSLTWMCRQNIAKKLAIESVEDIFRCFITLFLACTNIWVPGISRYFYLI